MKKILSRSLAILLSLIILLQAVPIVADDGIAELECSFSEGVLTISGKGAMPDYWNDNWNGYNPSPWDEYKDSITKVVITEGITTVGAIAFSNCYSLTEVVLPKGITVIRDSAFKGCTALQKLSIPDSVSVIEVHAFQFCSALSEINLGSGLKVIEYAAFSDTSSLKKVDLPQGLTTIEGYAFSHSGLERISIPDSVTDIQEDVFNACSELVEVSLPDGITGIPDGMFHDCYSLRTLSIPDSVKRIGTFAFSHATSLKEVDLPQGLTTLGNYAFAKTGIERISIPDSVTDIQNKVFYDCSKLVEVSLPDGITKIPNEMFYNCTSLQKLSIPDSVKEIGDYAFCGCTSLSTLVLPTELVRIGYSAFYGCSSLECLTVYGNVEYIADAWAFRNCPMLTVYTLPDSYVWEFCVSDNIPVHPIINSTPVTLTVMGEGNTLTDGYTVNWYNKGSDTIIGQGNTLYNITVGTEYEYEIILDEELSYIYKQPEKTVLDTDNPECKLEKHKDVTLTGFVKNTEDTALSGAVVSVTQTYNGKYTLTTDTVSDSNGRYSIVIKNLPASVTVNQDGYYEHSLTLTGISEGSADFVLSPLPDSKISFTLSKCTAAARGEKPTVTPVTNIEGLDLVIKNITQNKYITDFSFRYPYVIVTEADPGDILEITLSASDGSMRSEPVRVTLDENKCGHFDVILTENGRFRVSEIISDTKALAMVFDSNGGFVCSESISGSYTSRPLKDGKYSVVFIENTSLLKSVADINTLSEFGLSEGEHYTLNSVKISNGAISIIDTVTVPELDETDLFITNPDNTHLTLLNNDIVVGEYIRLRIEYEISPKYTTDAESVLIDFNGLDLFDGRVYLDGIRCLYSVNDGTVSVNTNKNKGILYLYLTGTRAGEYTINARLSAETQNGIIYQPIASAKLTVSASKIYVPEKTDSSTVPVSGISYPYAEVEIFENGVSAGKTSANALGEWKTQIELNKTYSRSYHEIYALITVKELSYTDTTESKWITHIDDLPEISKITMINIGDNIENVCVFDFNNPGETPHYSCSPSVFPTFTFKVETTGDPKNISELYVYTTGSNGETVYVECTYDESSMLWIGTHDYKTFADMPLTVGVMYDDTYAGYISDIDMDIVQDIEDECVNEYNALVAELTAGIHVNRAKYEEMDVNELSDSINSISDEIEILVSEYDYIKNTSTEDSGIKISADDDSATISSEDFTAAVKLKQSNSSSADLINSGYEAKPTNKGNNIYVSQNNNNVKVVMPDENIEIDVNVALDESILSPEGETEYEKIINQADKAVDLSNNIVAAGTHFSMAMNGKESFLVNRLKHLTELDANNDEAIRVYLDKINELRDAGAPESEIQKMMDIRTRHCVRQSGITNALNARTSQLAVLRNLDKAGKFLGGVGFIFDIATIKEYASQIEALRKSLPTSCPGDAAELAQIKRDINKLLAAMIGHVGGSMVMNIIAVSVPFTGGAVFAPVTGGGSIYAAAAVIGVMTALTTAADIAFAKNIERNYDNLCKRIAQLDCDGDGDGGSGGGGGSGTPPFKAIPIIDPSGYVYEAVPSNRVEGVCASAYYVENGEEILWNAEDYGQQNPLYTDKNGMFAWDVPFGEWLVKFSKDGYYDTDTRNDPAANENGYLPVPPPQLDVNTAIVSKSSPTVKAINVYSDEIQIIFSQYMQIDTVNADNITVSSDGNRITGSVSASNAEQNYDKTAEYASIFIFKPDTSLTDDTTVEISSVKNYNGVVIENTFCATKPVTVKPEAVSVIEAVSVLHDSKQTVEIQILPASAGANKVLTLTNTSPSIVGIEADRITTDENGKATVDITGKLPGNGEITLCLDGTELSASTFITVTPKQSEEQLCEAVKANIKSGSVVTKGAELTLTTKTDGAEIYYTLDGSCPCVVDSPSRIKYTGPISIDEDMFIIAYAVKDGYEDSSTKSFVYTVEWENPFTDVKKNHWFYESVETVVSKGYMVGMSETKFSPTSLLTREQFVQILFAMEGMNKDDFTGNTGFSDAPAGRWYSPAVKWAKQEGISNGMGNGNFGIGGNITREQLAMFMQNYADYKSYNTDGRADISAYEDAVKVSGWAKEAVQWAVYEGIFQSTSDTKLMLDPRAVATRAVVARVVCVYDELINN